MRDLSNVNLDKIVEGLVEQHLAHCQEYHWNTGLISCSLGYAICAYQNAQ